MRYETSKAKAQFERRARTLCESAHYADREKILRRDAKDLIFRCAIFELSAALEDYISQSIKNWSFHANKNKIQISRLPEETRTYLHIKNLMPAYKRFLYSDNETEILKKTRVTSQSHTPVIGEAPVPAYLGNIILDGKKYPSVDNLKAVFRRLGVVDLFETLSRATKTDFELRLTSFSDVRNAIAHEEPPALTIDDIDRHHGTVSIFVDEVDRKLHRHFCGYTGAECWATELTFPESRASI